MMRSIVLAITFLVLGAFSSHAQPPSNSVKWGKLSPGVLTDPTGNKITASGTYTTAAGWTPSGDPVLFAVPTGGGAFLSTEGSLTINPQTWGGTTIDKVVSGQYTVYAVINFVDGNGNTSTVSSVTSIINVP